jgi:hypothetical protein
LDVKCNIPKKAPADALWAPNDTLENKVRAIIRALEMDDLAPHQIHRAGMLLVRYGASMMTDEPAGPLKDEHVEDRSGA